MLRRAIVLVPGFGRKERNEARDRLVTAIGYYTDGWRVERGEQPPADAVRLKASARQGDAEYRIDVFEAYWGDLIPDWSNESPLTRVRRGGALLWYWFGGGLCNWIRWRKAPPLTSVAMIIAGLLLLVWYAMVILLLFKAIGEGSLKPPEVIKTIAQLNVFWQKIAAISGTIAVSGVMALATALWGLGTLEQFANTASYLKAYLRDDSFGPDRMGVRAKARKRVIDVLDRLTVPATAGDAGSDGPEEGYDEIFVVGHSLGGAIAIDALAEYGETLERTVLFTWGSALGLLAQQETQIEREIAKFYTSETRIMNWIDIVFRRDWMGSRVPIPRRFVGMEPTVPHDPLFPDAERPRLPKGTSLFGLMRIHEAYFRCEEAILMLVEPITQLKQRKDQGGGAPGA